MPVAHPDFLESNAIGPKLVRHDDLGLTVSAHGFLEEFQSGLLVSSQVLLTEPTYPMPPEPDSVVANFDAAFMEQILDVLKPEREANLEHHREPKDFKAGPKVL